MNKLTISAKMDKWAIRYRQVKTVMKYENRSPESQKGVPNCLLGIEVSPVTGSWKLAYLIVWSGTINFYVVYWLSYLFFLKGGTSRRLWKLLSFMVGGTIALCIGLLTSVYLATLHENDLWFSNIKVWHPITVVWFTHQYLQ